MGNIILTGDEMRALKRLARAGRALFSRQVGERGVRQRISRRGWASVTTRYLTAKERKELKTKVISGSWYTITELGRTAVNEGQLFRRNTNHPQLIEREPHDGHVKNKLTRLAAQAVDSITSGKFGGVELDEADLSILKRSGARGAIVFHLWPMGFPLKYVAWAMRPYYTGKYFPVEADVHCALQVLRKNGYDKQRPRIKNGHRRKDGIEEKIEKARLLRDEGCSLEEISQFLGFSRNHIVNVWGIK